MTSSLNLHPYQESCEFTFHLGGQEIHYVSKPGLPFWDEIKPSASLLAEYPHPQNQDRLLWLGCGCGAAVTTLALRFPGVEFWLMDDNIIALQMAAQTLKLNLISNAQIHPEISVLPEQDEAFDLVVIDLPKGRKLAQHWLAEAWHALRNKGHLYLAGANSLGIQTIIKDARMLYGSPTILDYMKGNRIVRFIKNQEGIINCPWLHENGIAPGTWNEFVARTPIGAFNLFSLPGIFSYDHIDEGTDLLLTKLGISSNERVLDLGCGYGIIGLIAAQTGSADVDLVDVSLLAIAATKQNLARYHINNAQAMPSDALSAVSEKHYTQIISNPPFHTGKDIDYQVAQAFIQQSWQSLESGGRLMLVTNLFTHFDATLKVFFRQIECLVKTRRYRVIQAIK
jgi:16S rRNA (guanine1207-N2)-methyltransferase